MKYTAFFLGSLLAFVGGWYVTTLVPGMFLGAQVVNIEVELSDFEYESDESSGAAQPVEMPAEEISAEPGDGAESVMAPQVPDGAAAGQPGEMEAVLEVPMEQPETESAAAIMPLEMKAQRLPATGNVLASVAVLSALIAAGYCMIRRSQARNRA